MIIAHSRRIAFTDAGNHFREDVTRLAPVQQRGFERLREHVRRREPERDFERIAIFEREALENAGAPAEIELREKGYVALDAGGLDDERAPLPNDPRKSSIVPLQKFLLSRASGTAKSTTLHLRRQCAGAALPRDPIHLWQSHADRHRFGDGLSGPSRQGDGKVFRRRTA